MTAREKAMKVPVHPFREVTYKGLNYNTAALPVHTAGDASPFGIADIYELPTGDMILVLENSYRILELMSEEESEPFKKARRQ